MELEKIPPEVFVNSVIYAAHKQYGSKRVNIYRWKAMKLIFEVANEIDYPNLSFGCYKYGWYSFQTDSFLRDIFSSKSLHGGKFDRTLIDQDLINYLFPTIKKMESIFTKKRYSTFLNWAHQEKIPVEYRSLYLCNDKLLENLKNLDKIRFKKDIPQYYDIISDIVSRFEPNLRHIKEDYLNIYFDYIDQLEGVLLVCKRRNFNAKFVKKIFNDLLILYEKEISTFIFPFIDTLTGENKSYEIEVYSTNIQKKTDTILSKLDGIKQKIILYNLNPSLDDFDLEIKSEISRLDQSERKEITAFLSTLSHHAVD